MGDVKKKAGLIIRKKGKKQRWEGIRKRQGGHESVLHIGTGLVAVHFLTQKRGGAKHCEKRSEVCEGGAENKRLCRLKEGPVNKVPTHGLEMGKKSRRENFMPLVKKGCQIGNRNAEA